MNEDLDLKSSQFLKLFHKRMKTNNVTTGLSCHIIYIPCYLSQSLFLAYRKYRSSSNTRRLKYTLISNKVENYFYQYRKCLGNSPIYDMISLIQSKIIFFSKLIKNIYRYLAPKFLSNLFREPKPIEPIIELVYEANNI